jgi:1,4-alpha-glucan branching enzyme
MTRVDTVQLVRFIFVATDARSVALVGDFNGWDRSAVRLTRSGTGGVWSATVRLPAGRHEYAFLVDGERWVADPNAPSSIEDEFGVESSVVTVDPARTTSSSRT